MWHSESHGRLKKLIDDIIKENDWIVEGSPRKVLKENFDCCDNVIVLDEYTILWLNIKWVFEFNRMKKGLLQELSTYGEKVKIFKHSKDAYAFVMENYLQA